MILPVDCACGKNQWFVWQHVPFTGKIETSCCITTIHVKVDMIEFSV